MTNTTSSAGVWRFAITLVSLAVAVVAVSLMTYAVSPPDVREAGNANTALYFGLGSGVLLGICAAMSVMINTNRAVGMIGIHVGLILPLLLLIGTAPRIPGTLEAAANYYGLEGTPAAAAEIREDDRLDTPHPRGYQAVGLGAVASLAGFGFVALVVQRPPVPKKKPAGGENNRSPADES